MQFRCAPLFFTGGVGIFNNQVMDNGVGFALLLEVLAAMDDEELHAVLASDAQIVARLMLAVGCCSFMVAHRMVLMWSIHFVRLAIPNISITISCIACHSTRCKLFCSNTYCSSG